MAEIEEVLIRLKSKEAGDGSKTDDTPERKKDPKEINNCGYHPDSDGVEIVPAQNKKETTASNNFPDNASGNVLAVFLNQLMVRD